MDPIAIVQNELACYLRTTEGQQQSDTGFEVNESSVINVLLVGRSQAGKTTLGQSLKCSTYASHLRGFADTRDVTHLPMIIKDKRNGKYYQINLIDTVGLHERTQNPDETRNDQEILSLAAKFIEKAITTLHVVIFVSKAGDLILNDLEVFQSLMKFLGPCFKNNTMMVLTHADGYSKERIDTFINTIKTHPSSKEIAAYCGLGIYPHGTVNFDYLGTFAGDRGSDLRIGIIKEKLDQITPMRRRILELIIEQEGRQQHVQEINEIMQRANETRRNYVSTLIETNRIHLERRQVCTIL